MLCTCHVNAEVNAYVHSVNQQGSDVTHHSQHVNRCRVNVNHQYYVVNADANYYIHIVDMQVHIVNYWRFDVYKGSSFVNGCCVNCSHQCHVIEEVNSDARNVNPWHPNVDN